MKRKFARIQEPETQVRQGPKTVKRKSAKAHKRKRKFAKSQTPDAEVAKSQKPRSASSPLSVIENRKRKSAASQKRKCKFAK